MNRGKMRSGLFLLLIAVLLLSSSSLTVARPPHRNYDEAELDLSAVYSSLNLTKKEMVSSLNYSLQVNYSQRYEDKVEGYEYGFIDATFNNETFDLMVETEEQIHSDLSNVKGLIQEIEDDVPSYVYLRRYYLPFYDLSENLTTFSENHYSFVLNMSQGVDIFNRISENGTSEIHHLDMMERIDSASLALEMMSDSLDRMEMDIVKIMERVEENRFNFTDMDERIDDLRELIEEYREYLNMLIRVQSKLPAFLTARFPDTVHPGEKTEARGIFVEGYIFNMDAEEYKQYLDEGPVPDELIEAFEEKGHPLSEEADIEREDNEKWSITADGKKMYKVEERITGELEISLTKEYCKHENITIFLDGKEIAQNESRKNNYYRSEVKIPWNIFSEEGDWTLDHGEIIELKAVSDDQNITSEVKKVKVERWPADIELNLKEEREGYFDENVSIEGKFICRAPIDFDLVNLSSQPTTQVDKDDDFIFHLAYHTRRFDWGENTANVSYQKNETIDNASEKISFKKNIPTELTIDSNKGEEEIEHLEIEGRLLNASSDEEVLENKEVVLKLNGEELNKTDTASEGSYNFTISVDSLEGGDVLYTYFEGNRIFRESRSEELKIGPETIDEEEPDPVLDIIEKNLLILILAIIIVIGLIVSFLLWKREKVSSEGGEDRGPSESETTKRERKKIPGKKTPSLQATSKGEVSAIYGKLLSRLYLEGVISVKKGKTHRELERELILKTDLKEEIRNLTSIFEKALFTDQTIVSSDLQNFNSSLKEVEEELL